MTCKEIEDLLPGMIDGALPETEKKAHRGASGDVRVLPQSSCGLENVR